MASTKTNRRVKKIPLTKDFNSILQIAREAFASGHYNESFDAYEHALSNFSNNAIEILSEAYDKYQLLPDRNRFSLYQSRIYDFDIEHCEKVIDIGSGHMPFPFATHLADISLEDHNYGRAGVSFKHKDGKPCFEFNIESIPFEDNEFDFVYCSHVLEHTEFPEKACREIMRISRRGYIETPTRAKDLWLNSAKISNHKWAVELVNDALTFDEYEQAELSGMETDLLMNMHVAPESEREKAFSALIYLKPDLFNTMVYWENEFDFEVRRKGRSPVNILLGGKTEQKIKKEDEPKFVQVHTFYPNYLENFYARNREAAELNFENEREALLHDGFSAVHLLTPELSKIGYKAQTIIANCMSLQSKWLQENNQKIRNEKNPIEDILLQQIETIKPDILYFTDPINFDSRFVRKLSYKPKLVIGWRAASITEGTDWSEFDLILTSLNGLKDYALKLGAKSSELFYPGFPTWILKHTQNVKPIFDLSFAGQWTVAQHTQRNAYLKAIAESAFSRGNFKPAFYLSGQTETIDPSVKIFDYGMRFGVEMHKAIKSGCIAFDARGDINVKDKNSLIDLTNNETANMRIFEATGEGVFLLTEYRKNLEKLFEPGKEVETYTNEKELIDKIKYYSEHDNEREDIAAAGQKKCLTEHALDVRIKKFDEIIKRNLDGGRYERPNLLVNAEQRLSNFDEVKKIVQDAAAKLGNNKADEAFQLLIQAKSYKVPFENLDTLRAAYFLQTNQIIAAKDCVYEELSHFPENEIAKNLLKQLETPVSGATNDDEFNQVLSVIKPYTMLSVERLYSLWILAKNVCESNLNGNFAECGVARGGSSALLAYVIKHYSNSPRKLFSFDTFEGMPEPTDEDMHHGIAANDTGWGTGTCSAPKDSLMEICKKLEVAEFINPVEGFFQKTLPALKNEIGKIALLHMDGDWYESTKSILENLYDLIQPNAFVQVDDFGFWEGCRKAVYEFQTKRNLKFQTNRIDDTGVWFIKPAVKEKVQAVTSVIDFGDNPRMLNLGCGSRYHNKWTNVDFYSNDPNITVFNLRKGIPFSDEEFHVVYHSHLLEHFPKDVAQGFINECSRVLVKGGVIRIAVPDLEQIVRHYLENLEKAADGDVEAKEKYEWMMLEMYDQVVRNFSGGEMLKYWKRNPMPAEEFVIERLGSEVKGILGQLRTAPGGNGYKKNYSAEEIGNFRLAGEIHQWMYDRYSLGELLKKCGFENIHVCKANESLIPNFNKYLLDIEQDGSIRKPDSLFVEATK